MKKIRIQKLHTSNRTLQQLLTDYLFAVPLFLAVLIGFFRLPGFVKYTVDIAWIGLLLLTLIRKRITIRKHMVPLVCLALVFFLYVLIGYIFQYQSAVYFLWGLRNNFRYYVAFFSFAAFFTEEDVKKRLDFLDRLFWVDIVVALVQFFILGYSQDYLGGIFGVERGCNASTLLFFSVVLTKTMLQMMMGEKKTGPSIAQLSAASVVAALAELKVFFVVVLLILVLAALMTNFSWKKCLLFLVMGLCMFMASSTLMTLFGSSSNLRPDRILELIFSENYSTSNDLGRLNAIPVLSRTLLRDPLQQWVGLGLGNCDTSAFAVCNTPFYQAHEQMHYTWFSSAFLFLETGYIGLVLYLSFFGAILITAYSRMRRGTFRQLYARIAIIMAVMCVVLTVYNASLRTDMGYLAYFALALPFAGKGKPANGEG